MKAIIHPEIQNAMQAGPGINEMWILEYQRVTPVMTEPLMGWDSSIEPTQQIKLEFKSQIEAEDYARRNNIEYDIVMPQKRKIIPKSYASNFS